MNHNQLKKLIEIFEGTTLSELTVAGLFRSVTLKRGGAPVVSTIQAAAPATTATEPAAEPVPVDDSKLIYITAPMVGTFYSASSPDADPFVKVGDSISKGTTVCIIEAMKVMNEIESELGGTIAKVLVENAQPVEYGQKLFAVRPH